MTDLLAGIQGVVCDLDGVVYRGRGGVPRAAETLNSLEDRGVRVLYATNNAARPPGVVSEHLQELGVRAAPDDVVTCSQAAAVEVRRMLDPGSHRVLALGGEGVAEALREQGLDVVLPTALAQATLDGRAPDMVTVVVQGLGPDLRVRDFNEGVRAIAGGATWVATNDDATIPQAGIELPGNGAWLSAVATPLRRTPDLVAGKPHPPLYRLAMDRLGVEPQACLAVGDRLETDIDGAIALGMRSALVLTGVHRPADAALRDAARRPDVVILSIADLLLPFEPAQPLSDGSVVCGAARAVLVDGSMVVDGGDDPQRLQAGLTLLYRLRDDGASSADISRWASVLPQGDRG